MSTKEKYLSLLLNWNESQNTVFDSFQNWQEPHNGNTHWILKLGAIHSAQDKVRPYCRCHHFHSVLCLKLGHIKVQDTALSTLAGWKAAASCARSTGCESWPGLGVSVSGWPRCTRLTMPEQWDGAGPRHRLIYGDRSGPAGGQHQDSPKVLCSSWS